MLLHGVYSIMLMLNLCCIGIQPHPLSQAFRMGAHGYPGPLPHPHSAHYHHPAHPHLAVRFDAGGHAYMNWVSCTGCYNSLRWFAGGIFMEGGSLFVRVICCDKLYSLSFTCGEVAKQFPYSRKTISYLIVVSELPLDCSTVHMYVVRALVKRYTHPCVCGVMS